MLRFLPWVVDVIEHNHFSDLAPEKFQLPWTPRKDVVSPGTLFHGGGVSHTPHADTPRNGAARDKWPSVRESRSQVAR